MLYAFDYVPHPTVYADVHNRQQNYVVSAISLMLAVTILLREYNFNHLTRHKYRAKTAEEETRIVFEECNGASLPGLRAGNIAFIP